MIAVIFILPLVSSRSFEFAADLVRNYPYVAPVTVIGLRFLGVVVAPIPGSPIMFASIAILPWWQAWLYNFLGSMIGSICAFLIARRFHEPVVAHFAPLREIHRWQETISQRKQFWAFVGLRFLGLLVSDFVNYAAGLTKMPFRTYLTATLLVEIPVGFLFYYLGGVALHYGLFIFMIAIALFTAAGVVIKLKYWTPMVRG